jgi:hypothetical protein
MIVFNGCSFTKYFWPSWADMLCYGYEDRINLGNMGSGNEYIFLTTYPYLNKASKVCIQWSGHNRFDYCKNGKWNIDGNITLNHLGNWDKVKWFYDEDHFTYKNETIINSFSDLLKYHNVGYYYMDLESLKARVGESTYNFKTTPNKFVNKKNFRDGHPDVYLHYEIAEEVADNLNIDFNRKEVKDKLKKIHNDLQNIDHLATIWNNPITLEKEL